MIVFESRHTRRFVVRVERGEDLVASLKRLAQSERFRAAWVRGTGLCEWAEVTDWDPDREALRAPRHLSGPLALLTCEGNVSMRLGEPYVELRGVLSREGDGGLQVLGGQLVVVAATNVELVLEVFEDVRLDRDEERETGLSVWKGERTPGAVARATKRAGQVARPHATPASRSASGLPEEEDAPEDESRSVDSHAPHRSEGTPPQVGWSDVARASTQREAAPRPAEVVRKPGAPPLVPVFDRPAPKAAVDDDEPSPRKGDWVDHRQFGLCRVDGEDVDGGLLIRLPSGMRKVVQIDLLEVLPPRFEGDRRIFALRPRKR
jgi:predicted DNA-binding protein with PD1-like motif